MQGEYIIGKLRNIIFISNLQQQSPRGKVVVYLKSILLLCTGTILAVGAHFLFIPHLFSKSICYEKKSI
jgi:hypothetical protein